jgi:hypothetical protein
VVGTSDRTGRSPALRPGDALVLLGALGALVALNLPELGSDPWPFRPPPANPRGPLAALVRASGGAWEPGLLRAAGAVAGLLVALVAGVVLSRGGLGRGLAVTTAVLVVALLLVPGVALQVGLREATAPWFHNNDSTYQIELAGELIRRGDSPYGHDYSRSGLERFYSLDGSVSPETRAGQVALRHFAYFPGTPLTAAAWGALPAPLDDYRILVALTSLAALPAALLFRGPLGARLALGAALAASPLAVRAAWFGTADAPAVLAVVLAFGLLVRRRHVGAAIALAIAVLLKQFAVVAVPFFAVALLGRVRRRRLVLAGAAFAAVLAVGFAPFLIADAGALVADAIAYGGEIYRIIGYGLAGILLEVGAIDDRFGPYPFAVLALLVWLPLTAWLVWAQSRSPAVWTAAAGFAASILVLLFIGRVFQTSYLVWPLAASLLAGLLALSEDSRSLVEQQVTPGGGSAAEGRLERASPSHAHPDPVRGGA